MEINDLIPRVHPDLVKVMSEVPQPRKDDSFVDSMREAYGGNDMLSPLVDLHDKDPNVELMESSDSFGNVPVAVFHPEARPERRALPHLVPWRWADCRVLSNGLFIL